MGSALGMRRKKGVMRSSITAALAAAVASAALVAPSAAQAETYTWSNSDYLSAGAALRDPYIHPLAFDAHDNYFI